MSGYTITRSAPSYLSECAFRDEEQENNQICACCMDERTAVWESERNSSRVAFADVRLGTILTSPSVLVP